MVIWLTKFETKIKQIGEYLSCNEEELWSEIKQICLDKQMVREAIEKICSKCEGPGIISLKRDMLKELGL